MLSIARCSLNEPPRGTSLFYFIYLFIYLFESPYPPRVAQQKLQLIRDRALMLHEVQTPPGSVPAPTRALNNEVTYMMTRDLDLEFDIDFV